MTTTTTTTAAAAQHKDWWLINLDRIIELMAAEMEEEEDTIESVAYGLKEAGTWPSLAPDDAGYAQAYEALLRAAVRAHCASISRSRIIMQYSDKKEEEEEEEEAVVAQQQRVVALIEKTGKKKRPFSSSCNKCAQSNNNNKKRTVARVQEAD